MHPALLATLYVAVFTLFFFICFAFLKLLLDVVPIIGAMIVIFAIIALWYLIYDECRKDW